MKKINFYIPSPTLERLQTLATERDVSVAELIRKALEEFLAKQ
jgi:predicted transcriptional regulator